MIMLWYDKKGVKLPSTYHNSEILVAKYNFQKEEVFKPESIIDYNKNMRGKISWIKEFLTSNLKEIRDDGL